MCQRLDERIPSLSALFYNHHLTAVLVEHAGTTTRSTSRCCASPRALLAMRQGTKMARTRGRPKFAASSRQRQLSRPRQPLPLRARGEERITADGGLGLRRGGSRPGSTRRSGAVVPPSCLPTFCIPRWLASEAVAAAPPCPLPSVLQNRPNRETLSTAFVHPLECLGTHAPTKRTFAPVQTQQAEAMTSGRPSTTSKLSAGAAPSRDGRSAWRMFPEEEGE